MRDQTYQNENRILDIKYYFENVSDFLENLKVISLHTEIK